MTKEIPDLNERRIPGLLDNVSALEAYAYRGYFLDLAALWRRVDSCDTDLERYLLDRFANEVAENTRWLTEVREQAETGDYAGCEHFTFGLQQALHDILCGTHESWTCVHCRPEYQDAWELLAAVEGVPCFSGFGHKYASKYLGQFKGHCEELGAAKWLELRPPNPPYPLAFSFTMAEAEAELAQLAGRVSWVDRILAANDIAGVRESMNAEPLSCAITHTCQLAIYWMKISLLLRQDFVLFTRSTHMFDLLENGWWSLPGKGRHN